LYFFFGVSWAAGGGGPLAILPLNKPSRLAPSFPMITGHTAPILDFDFNPFNEYQVLTGSEDMTAKIWQIPEEGITENVTSPLVSFEGHQKKVHIALYHKVAENIVTTASHDQTIRIWDVTKGASVVTYDNIPDVSWSVAYNWNGSNLVSSGKDKEVRIFDARTKAAVKNWQAHKGTKPSKALYAGRRDLIITVGYSKQSERQVMLWDPRNVDQPLHSIDIDVAAGMLMPMYDDDTDVLYLAGKGDTSVKFFEVTDEAPNLFALNNYGSTKPQKSVCILPKMAGDIMKCEVSRMLRLIDDTIEVISLRVPRKATDFQEDIFQDTAAPVAALTSDQWLAGQNATPKLMSVKPGEQGAAGSAPKKVVKSVFQLQQELDEKDKRIAELEAKLAALGK